MKMSRVQRLLINRTNNRKKYELVVRMLDLAGAGELGRVLEIGCGAGFVAAGLNERYGTSVVGVDIDPKQIKIARSRYRERAGLQFLEADAAHLPFENEEFDLVISQMVLHHIPDWEDTLAELARVLKRGRLYIFDDAVYTDFTRRYLRPLLRGHSFYSEESVAAVLRGHSLHMVHKEEQWVSMKFLVGDCAMVFRKQT